MKAGVRMKWFKRIVVILLVIFVVYFIIVYPVQSAGALKTFGDFIRTAFWKVYDFFANLG